MSSVPLARSDRFRSAFQRTRATQKAKTRGAPAYSLYVNRPAGRVLAAGAYTLGLTPDIVTAISAAFTFAGILVLALVPPQVATGIAVALLLAIGYAFDSADGQLARLRGGGSRAGEWLDHVVDATKISALHIAVLISWFRWYDVHASWLLVPLAYCLVAAVTFFGMVLTELLERSAAASVAPEGGNHSSALRSLVALPTDYGVLCVVFLLLGVHGLFIFAYTAMAAAALYLVAALVKWHRDLRRIDRAVRS